jgi:dihydroflavonol-4-reductase
MKNLVTGATGLVGTHILVDLLKNGEYVRATKTSNSNLELVKKILKYYELEEHFEKIEWVDLDVLDISQCIDAVKDIDHVYHSAAIVSFLKKEREMMYKINIEGTANIVNACLAENVKKIGFISSVAAIGRNKSNTYSEKNKWSTNKDNSHYSITKYKSENEIWRGVQEGLDAVITNPGIILGPGDWNRSSTTFFKSVKKGLPYFPVGKNGFVDVRDVSRTIIQLTKSKVNAEKYIIVAKNCSYEQIFKTIASSFNIPIPSKKASPFLLEVAWRFAGIKTLFSSRKPSITKETARTSSMENIYENNKIIDELSYKFNSIEDAIKNATDYFKN